MWDLKLKHENQIRMKILQVVVNDEDCSNTQAAPASLLHVPAAAPGRRSSFVSKVATLMFSRLQLLGVVDDEDCSSATATRLWLHGSVDVLAKTAPTPASLRLVAAKGGRMKQSRSARGNYSFGWRGAPARAASSPGRARLLPPLTLSSPL
jgi:hypothetical protein